MRHRGIVGDTADSDIPNGTANPPISDFGADFYRVWRICGLRHRAADPALWPSHGRQLLAFLPLVRGARGGRAAHQWLTPDFRAPIARPASNRWLFDVSADAVCAKGRPDYAHFTRAEIDLVDEVFYRSARPRARALRPTPPRRLPCSLRPREAQESISFRPLAPPDPRVCPHSPAASGAGAVPPPVRRRHRVRVLQAVLPYVRAALPGRLARRRPDQRPQRPGRAPRMQELLQGL